MIGLSSVTSFVWGGLQCCSDSLDLNDTYVFLEYSIYLDDNASAGDEYCFHNPQELMERWKKYIGSQGRSMRNSSNPSRDEKKIAHYAITNVYGIYIYIFFNIFFNFIEYEAVFVFDLNVDKKS